MSMMKWNDKKKRTTYVTTTFQKEVNFYREFVRDRNEKEDFKAEEAYFSRNDDSPVKVKVKVS